MWHLWAPDFTQEKFFQCVWYTRPYTATKQTMYMCTYQMSQRMMLAIQTQQWNHLLIPARQIIYNINTMTHL